MTRTYVCEITYWWEDELGHSIYTDKVEVSDSLDLVRKLLDLMEKGANETGKYYDPLEVKCEDEFLSIRAKEIIQTLSAIKFH